MKYLYLAILLLLTTALVHAQPVVPMDQPQRTPEEIARKQTSMLMRELNLTDSLVIDSIYRINVRHNKRRMQGLTRAQEYEGIQLFLSELKGVLTAEQFDRFMNHKMDMPRHPHASYMPSRPDSMPRKQPAQ